MPHKTFENLAGTKKKQIIREALKEFSLNDFNSASITAMVKELGIAKGSIYQYFSDKEDLYLFLLDYVWEKKTGLQKKSSGITPPESVRQLFFQINLVGLKFDLNFPEFAFFLLKANNEQHQIKGKTISNLQTNRGIEHFKSLLIQSQLKYLKFHPFLLFQLSSGLFSKLLMEYDIDPIQVLNNLQPVKTISDQQLITFVTEMSNPLF